MSAREAIGLRLAGAGALLLAPLIAQAALFLEGPSDWHRGELITIELQADEDTTINSFFFDAQYAPFASVLEIDNDPRVTLPAVIKAADPCNRDEIGDVCSFSAAPGKPISKGTLARWVFLVKEDAHLGSVGFNFDLNIEAATGTSIFPEAVDWPETKQFRVLTQAIPETSSWILMLAGLAAVGARSYRRRVAA